MSVIIFYSGGQKAAEVCDAANRWSWDRSTIKLWGPGEPAAREKPLAEFDAGNVVRLARPAALIRPYKGNDDPIYKGDDDE